MLNLGLVDDRVGTLFCGPKALGSTLHQKCNKWSSGEEHGTKFIWGKVSEPPAFPV
jgi:hypothetical protein